MARALFAVAKMVKLLRSTLLLSVFLILTVPVRANEDNWEYQVIILKGVMAGSTLEIQSRGISLDTRKTKILYGLAADGF